MSSPPFDRRGAAGNDHGASPKRDVRTRLEVGALEHDVRTTTPFGSAVGPAAVAPTASDAPERGRSHTTFGHVVHNLTGAPSQVASPPVHTQAPTAVPIAPQRAVFVESVRMPRPQVAPPPVSMTTVPQPLVKPVAPRATPEPHDVKQVGVHARGYLPEAASTRGKAPVSATEFVDMRAIMRPSTALPELGQGASDSSARWSTGTSLRLDAEFGGSAPVEKPPKVESGERVQDDDERASRRPRRDTNDLERSIRGTGPRLAWLAGACVLAVGVVIASFLSKQQPAAPLHAASVPQPVAAPAQAVVRQEPPPVAPSPPAQAREAMPVTAAPSAVAPGGAPAVGGERTGASQQSAAGLYLHGQYKEALAEYRLLASAYPNEKAYGEFARILKRKLVESCVRTQPNRKEQCKNQ